MEVKQYERKCVFTRKPVQSRVENSYYRVKGLAGEMERMGWVSRVR
jgi:hypothetical protein